MGVPRTRATIVGLLTRKAESTVAAKSSPGGCVRHLSLPFGSRRTQGGLRVFSRPADQRLRPSGDAVALPEVDGEGFGSG